MKQNREPESHVRKINDPTRSRCRFTVRGDFHAIEAPPRPISMLATSISTDDSTYSLFVYLYNKFRCTSVCSKLPRVNVTFLREKISIGLRAKFSDAIDAERDLEEWSVVDPVNVTRSRWEFCVVENLK